jgi:hypothetical protein
MLEDLASSCVAAVDFVDGQWNSVTLFDLGGRDHPDRTGQYHDQACFNGVYARYVSRRVTNLDRGGVRKFVRAFVESCASPGSGPAEQTPYALPSR